MTFGTYVYIFKIEFENDEHLNFADVFSCQNGVWG